MTSAICSGEDVEALFQPAEIIFNADALPGQRLIKLFGITLLIRRKGGDAFDWCDEEVLQVFCIVTKI